MLKELKFVQGAVAKRDIIPAMTHFWIRDSTVTAYNGVLALSSPIAFDIDCLPRADKLLKAIAKFDETITLTMAKNGKLRLQGGQLWSYVDCIDGEPPDIGPTGSLIDFDGEVFLNAVKTLVPFIGDDASRPWTNGILLRGESAFATNNVCLIQYWMGAPVPCVINIPRNALVEILRIDEAPVAFQGDRNSMTFHYSDGRWIRTQLLSTEWPDMVKIMDVPNSPSPVDPRLFIALDKLAGLGDGDDRVYMRDGVFRTTDMRFKENSSAHLDDADEEEVGSGYAVDGLNIEGIYSIKMLKLLQGVATHADFNRYPDATIFYGDRLRGAIIGMRH